MDGIRITESIFQIELRLTIETGGGFSIENQTIGGDEGVTQGSCQIHVMTILTVQTVVLQFGFHLTVETGIVVANSLVNVEIFSTNSTVVFSLIKFQTIGLSIGSANSIFQEKSAFTSETVI